MEETLKIIDMAVELSQRRFSTSEVEEILNGSDDVKKCMAIMSLENIPTQKMADILLFHLTDHGGTVREAVAIKLEILFEDNENIKFFQSEYAVNKICEAITDINPNISRLILEILSKIENKSLIQKNILSKLENSINNILKSDVLLNHQINKYYFKIYWLLEALNRLDNADINLFSPCLNQIAQLPEYTVREKVAHLSIKYEQELKYLKEKLINDENYYVRRIFDN